MKRRQFILGLGAAATGSTALLSSGAFSSVEAERAVTVETATDDNAYLRLNEGDRDDRSFEDTDGVLGFTFTGLREQREDRFDTNPSDPKGLGEETVYRFGRETDGNPLFNAENQGTQSIDIYGKQENTQGLPKVRIFNVDTGDLLTESQPYKGLAPGDPLDLGFEIDTSDVEVRDESYEINLTIVAEETD